MARQTFDELVERHARRWEAERRGPAPSPADPCVALSRLPMSGADELAEQVAGELGYEFFGIGLLDYIAREQHVQRRLLEGLDEHMRSAIDRYVIDAFRKGAFTETDYVQHVVRAITTIGEHGRAVILGRGAPYVLPRQRALRVLIVAPREQRLERLARAEGLDAATATGRLAELDAERREFLSLFGVDDPDDPTLYDLVLNVATLGSAAAAAQLVHAARLGAGPQRY